jgi:putative heme-binding domain-containing protein
VLKGLLLVWVSGMACQAPGGESSPENSPKPMEEYLRVAMQREGSAVRGEMLFANQQRTLCTKCHSVDGQGRKAGPDLSTAGDRFSRRELIEAVLTPSASIAVGYGTTLVTTKSGNAYLGVLKQATDSEIELMGMDGRQERIPAADIRERQGSVISFMPEALHAALSPEEFTDLVEYLVSLKQPARALAGLRGMPEEIPLLEKPVALRPFLNTDLRQAPPEGRPAGTPTGLVWFGQVPGRAELFLAAHQSGVLWLVEKRRDGERTGVFADLTSQVFSASGPNGLLGVAFHPQFPANRKYFLKRQVVEEGTMATVLEERRFSTDLTGDSGEPPRRLLKIASVAEHHNGGCLAFGPDGFLYLGMGDSAPNFDPQGFAQDLRLLFGKMLRLDVDRCDPGLSYAIPPDNPFRGRSDARPEIWASGLREPWRFSFDRLTGDLWVADLGQERGDEIDLVRRGDNCGWNVHEGFELFSSGHRRQGVTYAPPVFATRRRHGTAIIGGFVFRGDRQSSFYGVYVFGDHQSRRIWGLTLEHGALKHVRQLATAPQSIASFSCDEAGRLFVVGYQGMIYEMDFRSAVFAEEASVSLRALTRPHSRLAPRSEASKPFGAPVCPGHLHPSSNPPVCLP